jgi:hypothetical protein
MKGPTGIPAFTFNPSIEDDGVIQAMDHSLFNAAAKLYEIFDTITVDFKTSPPTVTPVILANLYQIHPRTAVAKWIAAVDQGITAAVDVNGTVYVFNGLTGEVDTLDLATGATIFHSVLGLPGGLLVLGAFPANQPASTDE